MADSSTATADPATNLYPYECMFLLDSSKYAADPEGTIETVLEMITKAGGQIVTHRVWKDGRLEYEIAGQRKGLHYLVMCEMPGPAGKAIERSVKLSELVLRHLILRHDRTLFDLMVQALNPSAEAADDVEEEETGDDE